MRLDVVAPVTGRVVAMSAVADPVFAQEIVGPGVAVIPGQEGVVRALAPVAGRIRSLHPHAFVVAAPEGPSVLIHLGLDTVSLRGRGFTLEAERDADVAAGDPVISWSPAEVRRQGLDPVVPVVILEAGALRLVGLVPAGERVEAGEPLLRLED